MNTKLHSAIDSAIADSITEVNLQQPADQQLTNTPDQPLAGEGGVLDSLGILLLLTALESHLKPALPTVNLVDALMHANNAAHFATVASLQAYLRTQD